MVKGEELPPVEKSDVVVVAGRGVGSTDGVKLLTELAKLLGGTIGGTKKAVDAGW